MNWAILLPLSGPDGGWFELCVCESAEKVADVIRSLCNAGPRCPATIKVEVRLL
jgi:hypothetical protein